MNITEDVKNYFDMVSKYNNEDEVRDRIGYWLDAKHSEYGIDYREYIYNKIEYIDKFYTTLYGKSKTTT